MSYQVICGNNIEVLKTLPDNSVDSIVTDPPYGIDFLGKSWDADTGSIETYQQCYRVLKPGGHLLAFSAARTYHHLAISVERSGFEIRDQIMWIYGSGFPKSQDVGRQLQKRLGVKETIKNPNHRADQIDANSFSKKTNSNIIIPTDEIAMAWSGWGTALKPAHEPIVLARKPVSEKNIADNCLKHGTGALNIDATRVEYAQDEVIDTAPRKAGIGAKKYAKGDDFAGDTSPEELQANQYYATASSLGRFPANVIHDGSDEVVSMFPDNCGNAAKATRTKTSITGTGASLTRVKQAGEDNGFYDGLGSAARFFYCAKVSRKERNVGCEDIVPRPLFNNPTGAMGANMGSKSTPSNNNHPTVKPVELMKYLIRLVTPPGGLVLDPFNGSGSTGMAAVELGYDYLGIDLDQNYVDISLARIAAWAEQHKPTAYSQLFKE
jgi:site-specific DNA-methyltransferase (adenine-specific)